MPSPPPTPASRVAQKATAPDALVAGADKRLELLVVKLRLASSALVSVRTSVVIAPPAAGTR